MFTLLARNLILTYSRFAFGISVGSTKKHKNSSFVSDVAVAFRSVLETLRGARGQFKQEASLEEKTLKRLKSKLA